MCQGRSQSGFAEPFEGRPNGAWQADGFQAPARVVVVQLKVVSYQLVQQRSALIAEFSIRRQHPVQRLILVVDPGSERVNEISAGGQTQSERQCAEQQVAGRIGDLVEGVADRRLV